MTDQLDDETPKLTEKAYTDQETFLKELLKNIDSTQTYSRLLISSVAGILGGTLGLWVSTLFPSSNEKTTTDSWLSASAGVLGGFLGVMAGNTLSNLLSDDDSSRKEQLDKALLYASDEFKRLSHLREIGRLAEKEFQKEIEELYEYTQELINSILAEKP